MKRISSLMLAVAMIISMAFMMNFAPIKASAAGSNVWNGTTVTQPTSMKTIDGVYYYEISAAEELAYIAKTGGDWLNYNYILANDIILNNIELTYDTNGNITVDTSTLNKWISIKGLQGIFDGNGFSISGVYMDSSESVAFFSSVGATVKNLNIKNSYIRSTGGSAAGICLSNGSEDIINCTFDGAVVGVNNVGGIVSSMYGYVKQSTNNGDIFGSGNNVGGIAGYLDCWGIENCTNNGTIHSTGNYVGGIVGKCGGLYTPTGCNNTGNVTGKDYVGGICGLGPDGGWASGNNSGDIVGEKYVGGLTGYADYGSMRGSINGNNTGDVTGTEYVGGLAGYLRNTSISNSHNSGNVTGNSLVGGLVGHSESIWGRGSVSNCYFLKTSNVNTNLFAFGNTNEDTDSATSKDATFFCISPDGNFNQSGHKYSSNVPCDAICDNCGYERTVTHIYNNIKYDSDKHWYECDCGEKKADSEASHAGGTATCTNKAKCDVCKQFYGDLNINNHTAATSWTSTNDQHYHTCSNGCDTKLDIANCSGGTATCQEKAKCDICKQTYGVFAEHNFDDTSWGYKAVDGHAHTCQTSGCSEHGIVVAHTSSDAATEDVAETCTECGYIISPALGHKKHTAKTEWSTDDKYHWHECTGCEGQQLDKSSHKDLDNNAKCDTCGATVPVGTVGEPDEDVNSDGDDLSSGAIAGIAVGSTVVVGIGSFSLIWFVIKKKSWADLLAVFKK